ncbi:MAG: cbb3-type cytochrome oxidase assembly protein CcoS [Bacteroidota bacterium]
MEGASLDQKILVYFYVESQKINCLRPVVHLTTGQLLLLMAVIPVLVVLSILIAGGFLIAFLWSVKSGQYEDTYSPSVRILFDDPPSKKEPSSDAKAPDAQETPSESSKK